MINPKHGGRCLLMDAAGVRHSTNLRFKLILFGRFFFWCRTAMYCIQQFWYICEILGSPSSVANDYGVWVKTLCHLANES